jgi:hypothetical protein
MTRLLAVLALVACAACGHKIGDSCTLSTDCSQDGTRVCDTFSPRGGYCTIQGCDYGTCPSEAVCVRFYPALEKGNTCNIPADCEPDEVCTIGGDCAPRSIEERFCMLSCSSDGDCRDGYECRTKPVMIAHGGEPVPDPNSNDLTVPNLPFCAPRRVCTLAGDCAATERCDLDLHVCLPAK